MPEAPRIFPTFRYRDAARMIDWLVEAFGFTVLARYPDDSSGVGHAELALGDSMIMLCSVRDDDYGCMVGGPDKSDGKSVLVAVADVDALFERARRAGARIEERPTDRP